MSGRKSKGNEDVQEKKLKWERQGMRKLKVRRFTY